MIEISKPISMRFTCRWCKKVFFFMINPKDFLDWKHGTLIQIAMPYLDAGQRELIVSNTCSDCFDSMFAEEK